MATLSPARAGWPLLPGLKLLSRGKVRDTCDLPFGSTDCLLSLATDGISIFDFVLNALVPMKGTILNCLNHFWSEHLCQFGIPTHLLAVGAGIDNYLPMRLQGNADLQSRASVIRRMRMAPVEFIYRSVLTGSAISSYKNDSTVCKHQLPLGLQDGDSLPCILDTPTTKAEEGHDENIDFGAVRARWPSQTMSGLQIFQICSNYCESRGIKLADTKFEFGESGRIGDEIVTPDSSRFWEFKAWLEGRKLGTRKAPPPYDKQLVRAWGIEQGINKRKPENPEDVAWVHSLVVPKKLIEQTTRIYCYIFWRLTGLTIDRYLREKLGVKVSRKIPSIQVICGSESDWPIVRHVVTSVLPEDAKLTVHIMSCHRNPYQVVDFTKDGSETDAVICVGGKAFALPGVIDAFAHASHHGDIPVIGVALGEPGSKSLLAAQLSIEEVPGTPVIMDEIAGVYTGSQGLRAAINRVVDGELPPPKPRTEKPVQTNVFKNF